MTTEKLIETILMEGRKAFLKKTQYESLEIRKLIRHEPVMIDGTEYNYLQELVVEKTAEFIQEILPDAEIEIELDGNNSTLSVELTEEEKRLLTSKLYVFLKTNRCI